jgi:hypothetical protein
MMISPTLEHHCLPSHDIPLQSDPGAASGQVLHRHRLLKLKPWRPLRQQKLLVKDFGQQKVVAFGIS